MTDETAARCENVDESAGLVRACETFPDDTMKNWCWPCIERHVATLQRELQRAREEKEELDTVWRENHRRQLNRAIQAEAENARLTEEREGHE